MHSEIGFLPSLRLPYQAVMPDVPTLAGWLTDAGYATAVVSANSWYSDEWNSVQGFEVTELYATNAKNEIAHGADIVQTAVMEGFADRWFLQVHVTEPHPAYAPPEAYLDGLAGLPPVPYDLSKFDAHYDAVDSWPLLDAEDQATLLAHLTVRYQGEIRYLDDQLADAWADLELRGMLDDTLVVIWNDHGESFWEHGHQSHAWTLHQQENGAFAIFWAKNIGAGAWAGPTHGIDVAPTVLAALGVPIPPEVTGVPVGLADPGRDRFVWTWARAGMETALIRSGYKLHFDWIGNRELYDRVADIDEEFDLYAEGDPVVEAMWPALQAEVERMIPYAKGVEPIWP
jgi:arylsulfatase A-like enzyme